MEFIYLYEINKETSCNIFKWGVRDLSGSDDLGYVTNVQYKFNQNCHYESPLYNEYILIKIYLKK
jgi:hypothetical protein